MIHIGSISSGTLRTEDLFDAIIYEAGGISMSRADRRRAFKLEDEFLKADEDEQCEILDDLWALVDSYAPPYVSLRMHEGDGADLGWWPDIDSLEDDARCGDNVIKVDAGDEWPKGTEAYVMEVNDHGNVALYDRRTKQELWSCV